MQLIVREWCDIDVEWEFRTFIFNNEMTAVTQYYSLVNCHVRLYKLVRLFVLLLLYSDFNMFLCAVLCARVCGPQATDLRSHQKFLA